MSTTYEKFKKIIGEKIKKYLNNFFSLLYLILCFIIY